MKLLAMEVILYESLFPGRFKAFQCRIFVFVFVYETKGPIRYIYIYSSFASTVFLTVLSNRR